MLMRFWLRAKGHSAKRFCFPFAPCSLRLGTLFQPAKRIFETLLAHLVPLPLVRFVAPGAIDFLL